MTPAALIDCRSIGASRQGTSGLRLSRALAGEDLVERAEALARGLAHDAGPIVRLEEVAHGRRGRRYVEDLAVPHDDDSRAVHIRPPHAADQERPLGIVGQGEFHAGVEAHSGRLPIASAAWTRRFAKLVSANGAPFNLAARRLRRSRRGYGGSAVPCCRP